MGTSFFCNHVSDLPDIAYAFFLRNWTLTDGVKLSPALSDGISAVFPFDLFWTCLFIRKVLGRIKVELVAFKGQVQGRELPRAMTHTELQRHLCVVEEPELAVESDLVEALDQGNVTADVELILKL